MSDDDPITRLGLSSNAVRVLDFQLEQLLRRLPEAEERAAAGGEAERRALEELRREIVTKQRLLERYREMPGGDD